MVEEVFPCLRAGNVSVVLSGFCRVGGVDIGVLFSSIGYHCDRGLLLFPVVVVMIMVAVMYAVLRGGRWVVVVVLSW